MHRPIRTKLNVWKYDVQNKKRVGENANLKCSGGKAAKAFDIIILCITILFSLGILVQRANICFSK